MTFLSNFLIKIVKNNQQTPAKIICLYFLLIICLYFFLFRRTERQYNAYSVTNELWIKIF